MVRFRALRTRPPLLVLVLCLALPVGAEAEEDVYGLDGSIWEVAGDRVIASYDPATGRLLTFWEGPGEDPDLDVTVSEDPSAPGEMLVEGRVQTYSPMGDEPCPDEWIRWSAFFGTLSADGNVIAGRFRVHLLNLESCEWTTTREWGKAIYVRARDTGRLELVSIAEPLAAEAAPRIELVLDASGSMVERSRTIDGRLKMEVAKEVVEEIVNLLPAGVEVGLRVYGRRIREGRPGDCEDTELLVPIAPLERAAFIEVVRGIEALGTTPLVYSLRQAAADFGAGAGPGAIVLVTDGKEECGGSPPEVAEELMAMGLGLKIDVVGFALADEATKEAMRQVAEITGGRFFDAQDREELYRALAGALAGVAFEVFDAGGALVAEGSVDGGAVELGPGSYEVVVYLAGAPLAVAEVVVAEGSLTLVELARSGDEVAATVHDPQP